MPTPSERRPREASSRRRGNGARDSDRERDSDRDRDRDHARAVKTRSRPTSSRPTRSRPRRDDDETIDSDDENEHRRRRRTRERHARSQSRSAVPLSAEALASLNAVNARRSRGSSPERTTRPRRDRDRTRPSRERSRPPPPPLDPPRRLAKGDTERGADRHKQRRSRSNYAAESALEESGGGGMRSGGYRRAPVSECEPAKISKARTAYSAADYMSGDETESWLSKYTRRKRRNRNVSSYEAEEDSAYNSGKRKLKRRLVSGAAAEEGLAIRGGTKHRPESEEYMLSEKSYNYDRSSRSSGFGRRKWNKKRICIFATVFLGLLIIFIALGVTLSRRHATDGPKGGGPDLGKIDRNSIPEAARGTYLDPFSWADTTGFNLTYTNETVGDLPIMGLFSTWDDSKRANEKVPPLNSPWGSFGSRPARGVNLGGWLNLEPFITPSLFNYDAKLGIVDEYTLCKYLGDKAAATMEKHYATFVTEQTFAAIRDAGLDHVRIPYGYWAVQTYDGDPYVFRTSWRYLLRGIEWARKYGLRINLDLHGLPGSQNGWNHSGRLGAIGWLNGSEGLINRQRSIDIHDRLSRFFAQDRYRNIVTFYGLANEPKMTALNAGDVLKWTEEVYRMVKANGVRAVQVFGDGFMGLDKWQGLLSGHSEDLALDVHQYVIFNVNQIVFTHQQKVQYACAGWAKQAVDSMNPATGYGPTLFAEWSLADNDCAQYLNNVGFGNRWEGTYNSGDPRTSALSPRCPTKDSSCTCLASNGDPGRWPADYKKFLRMFAEAQMSSFEKGWGWWYWTWQTESAPQWSYKAALAAGVLPKKAWQRDFNCDTDVPDFKGLSESI